MRILYDARKISPKSTGVGYVVKKLLEQLLTYKALEIIAFTSKGVKNIFDNPSQRSHLTICETNDDAEYFGLKRIFFEQTEIPKLIDTYKPTILHLTNGFGVPLLIDKNTKIVLTIHDLIPFTQYKELMSPLHNFIFKTLFSYGIKKADAIVAVSQFTARDVAQYFPNAKKAEIAYNGIDPFPRINNSNEIWSNLQKKYRINQEFILYIGGFAPRKNVLNLLESYRELIKEKKYKYQLLLCGKFTNNKDIKDQLDKINLFTTSHNLQKKVRLIGYLSKEEKYVLLSQSKFFVYLSLYEGFGLPVLEALSTGTPTITTKNSVMEEVAQKYSLYIDAQNTNDILDKMMLMLSKYEVYKNLALRAAKELLPTYNWKSAGEKYYQIYKNLL